MRNVENRARLMGQAMRDAQQGVGEGHAGQALGVMHPVPGVHVAVVAGHQILADHLDGMQGQGVRIIAVQGGYIGLDGVGHGVHTGMGGELLGHGLRQIRVHDGHVRGDVEVCQGVLDALVIVGDHGEGRHFRGRAGGGGDGAELGLGPQGGEVEGNAQLLKGGVRILVERPHGLGRVNGGTAANGNDPVRLEFLHGLGALHHRFHRGVRLYAFKQGHFHARRLQVGLYLVQETKPLHGAAAYHDDGLFAFKILERIQGAFAMI